MNSTKVLTLGATKVVCMHRYIGMRVQIFEKAHMLHVASPLTGSIQKICGENTEAKEKEAHCLTLQVAWLIL